VRGFVILGAVALLLAPCSACGDDDDAVPAATVCATETPSGMFGYAPVVEFDDQRLFVEIADNDEERRTGLMNRACLEENSGMLFFYSGDVQSTFWMHDTFVPLSIAFVAADGTILEVEDMQPETDDLHYAPGPYRYGIEANQGWFAQHGIEAGDVATLPPNLSAS
jgi:uncharacterized membrane protein (UPF0127 family)